MELLAQQQIPASAEADMKAGYELVELKAGKIVINDDEQYREAGEFAKSVKANMKTVKDYFAPMKEAAHKSHQAVCEREKQMLQPLLEAEKICKKAMSDFLRAKAEEARKQEEAMKRLAREEAERMLNAACEAEANGDAAGAEMAMAQASVADQIRTTASVSCATPKVAGISTSKDYEIVSITDNEVPISMNGMTIRPVDEKAIMRLIKASNGQIVIPGIEYRETVRMSVSSGR